MVSQGSASQPTTARQALEFPSRGWTPRAASMGTEHTRRDFLAIAAGSFAAVGGSAALWPFIDQMNPNPGSLRLDRVEVDLAPVQVGQSIVVLWKQIPVIVRNRTDREIELAHRVRVADLPDPYARRSELPAQAAASDKNRTVPGFERWLVVVGMCTHLGCQLRSQAPNFALSPDEMWLCPCHAARFDTSGRVRSGPARTNLPVPPITFLAPLRLRIG